MSEPKRILILVTSLDRGGVETMIMNYYRKIDRRKWQYDFLVNRSEIGAYEKEIKSLGGRIFRMGGMYPWRYLSYRREFMSFLRAHPEYDIIHSHLEERSYWPLKIAERMGIPVRVCHAHNVYPFNALDGKSYFRQWFRWGLGRGKIVTLRLACSSHAGKWLYGEKTSFEVITNAIDFEQLAFSASDRKRLRRELRITDGGKVMGFVGRLVKQKNPEYVLRVFAALPDREEWRLVLLGKGSERERLQVLARELGIEKFVFFGGEVPEVASYYSAFDVLLLPSLYEGLGMVTVEAGANGLPVVASNGVPEEANVVKNTTFVDLGDIQRWVEIAEREALRSMGNSRNVKMTKAMREYDINEAVERLERMYEGLTY